MKKITYIIFMMLPMLMGTISSCEKNDDAAQPDAGMEGIIMDQITKMPFQTQQETSSAGTRIRVLEDLAKYPNRTPFYLSVKPNGTYRNTQVFSGKYELLVVEGAFFPQVETTDTQTITVSGMTTVNFSVMPYLAITATPTTIAGGVSVKYKLLRDRVAGKINEARVIVASVPGVSNAVFDVIGGVNKVAIRTLTGVPDATVLATEYTDEITGLLSGKTYYVRVAARTATNTKYNYSPVFEVKIP